MKNLTNFCEIVELVWICARRFLSTAASYFLLGYRHNRSSLSTLNVVYIYLIIMKQSMKATLENHNFSNSQPFKCVVPENIHTPPPPPWKIIGNSEGEGGFKGGNFRGVWGVHGKLFPRGDRACTKHWKQLTINLKHKNIPTYVGLKQKSVLLAIDMRLTSLALMFLFFFELASATISRRTMCLWNEVENDWKWRT